MNSQFVIRSKLISIFLIIVCVVMASSAIGESDKQADIKEVCSRLEENLAIRMHEPKDEYRVYYDKEKDTFYGYCVISMYKAGLYYQSSEGYSKLYNLLKEGLGSEIYFRVMLTKISKPSLSSSSFVYAYLAEYMKALTITTWWKIGQSYRKTNIL